jgi:hypothetical protein
VASQRPRSGVDVFTLPANGETAGSYFTDGRWNRGGWATYPLTYPLRDERAGTAEEPWARVYSSDRK